MSFLLPSFIVLPCPHKTQWNTHTHALPWGEEWVGPELGLGEIAAPLSYLPTCYEPPWLFRRAWSLASHSGQLFAQLRFPGPCQGVQGRGSLHTPH